LTALAEKLSSSLVENDTELNRKQWASYIIDNNIALMDLVSILDKDRKAAMRFIWLVGGLCELKPEIVFPAIGYFYSRKNNIPFSNFDRSLAKMFWYAGIPEDIEGEVVDDLFRWLMNPAITVSTKNFALSALYHLTTKHVELKNELKIVLEDQLGKNTASFDKRAEKILEKLR
jgi:hypothetical protein